MNLLKRSREPAARNRKEKNKMNSYSDRMVPGRVERAFLLNL
jgi:hypothetical protein